MTAAAVMGLVIEAMRKIESRAIGDVPAASTRPDGLHLDMVAASHQAHRSRHRSVADVRLQDGMQVGHRSSPLQSAVRRKTAVAAHSHRAAATDVAPTSPRTARDRAAAVHGAGDGSGG